MAQSALVMMCAWLGDQNQAKGDWRYATMECGLLCVTSTYMMPPLLADNLDTHNMLVRQLTISIIIVTSCYYLICPQLFCHRGMGQAKHTSCP